MTKVAKKYLELSNSKKIFFSLQKNIRINDIDI